MRERTLAERRKLDETSYLCTRAGAPVTYTRAHGRAAESIDRAQERERERGALMYGKRANLEHKRNQFQLAFTAHRQWTTTTTMQMDPSETDHRAAAAAAT